MTSIEKKQLVIFSLQTDFSAFSRRVVEAVTRKQLSQDPYLDVLWFELERVARGEQKRLIVNMSPRHGKTLVGTVSLAAWELAHHPSNEVLIISYGEGLAREIGKDVREVLRAPWFEEIFSCRVATHHDREDSFSTTQGGQVRTTSFKGQVTGFGADLIIVDDAHKMEDANWPERLEKTNRQFDPAITSRLNDPHNGRIVVIGHRIAHDLSGTLLKQGGWKHLRMALVAEKAEQHVTRNGVWKRRPGELLRRGSYSPAALQRLRVSSGVPDFQTVFQQAPSNATSLLTEDLFPLFTSPPPSVGTRTVLSIDTAQGGAKAGNSFSVIQAFCWDGTDHYLLDQWREQAPYSVLCRAVRQYNERHRPSTILVEDTGVGSALVAEIRRGTKGRGIVVVPITPVGSKVDRLKNIVPVLNGRCVKLPSAKACTPLFLAEASSFPHGITDDQVDALVQYLTWASDNRDIGAAPARPVGLLGKRLSWDRTGQASKALRRDELLNAALLGGLWRRHH